MKNLELIKQIDKEAMDKIIERAVPYENLSNVPVWRSMSTDAILSGVVYRSSRARATKDLNKKLDDIYDSINYLRFVGVLVKEELEREKRLKSERSS
jgi:hypothetical protein